MRWLSTSLVDAGMSSNPIRRHFADIPRGWFKRMTSHLLFLFLLIFSLFSFGLPLEIFLPTPLHAIAFVTAIASVLAGIDKLLKGLFAWLFRLGTEPRRTQRHVAVGVTQILNGTVARPAEVEGDNHKERRHKKNKIFADRNLAYCCQFFCSLIVFSLWEWVIFRGSGGKAQPSWTIGGLGGFYLKTCSAKLLQIVLLDVPLKSISTLELCIPFVPSPLERTTNHLVLQ